MIGKSMFVEQNVRRDNAAKLPKTWELLGNSTNKDRTERTRSKRTTETG